MDYRALGKGIGADKLVVRGMVRYGDDADFSGDAFGPPAEIA